MQVQTSLSEEKKLSTKNNVEEEPFLVLQKLMSEEANLMEEKKSLASLREKLQLKAQRKIQRKKNRIQKLKAEIKDLRFSCEELSKSFRIALQVGAK
jgi:chromosome segregation ATPase